MPATLVGRRRPDWPDDLSRPGSAARPDPSLPTRLGPPARQVRPDAHLTIKLEITASAGRRDWTRSGQIQLYPPIPKMKSSRETITDTASLEISLPEDICSISDVDLFVDTKQKILLVESKFGHRFRLGIPESLDSEKRRRHHPYSSKPFHGRSTLIGSYEQRVCGRGSRCWF